MATFSNDAPGPGNVAAVPEGGGQAQPIRIAPVGQVAGQGGPVPRVDPQMQRNVDALMKLSADILAPKIAQAKQEQFMRGVQEAATGKALTEIINDRPWYTEIFGPSAAAQGARAYTVQAQVAGFAAEMENDMPRLAEQGPEVLRATVMERMKEAMTGDAAADAVITQAAVEQFAPLFKRHAKEHYVYLQNKASEAQLNAWDQAASVMQSQLADPKTTPEDRLAAGSRLLGQIGPFADQTEASYNQNVAKFLYSAAQKGNFNVIKMFRDTKTPDGKATLWELVPLEERSKLEAALPGMAQKALDNLTPKYAVEMAQITLDTAQNPALLPERIAAFNAKVAAAEGITDANMIPNRSVDQIVGRVMQAQAAAASASNPAVEKAERQRMAMAAVGVPGAMVQARTLGLTDDVSAELAATQAWNSNPDPVARAAVLNNRGGGTYDSLKGQLYTMGVGANPEQNTKGVEHVAGIYAAMNEANRALYFSTDEALFYDRYNDAVRSGVPPEFAFSSARNAQTLSRDLIPETERNEVQQTIRDVAESRNENWFGINSVTDSSLRLIEAAIGADYRKNRSLNSVEVSVQRAYTRALANGLAVIGSHAVRGVPGQKPLEMLLAQGEGNIGPQEVAKRFDKLIQEKVKSAGGSLDDYFILRTPDVNSDARFLLETTDSEGITRFISLSGNELRENRAKSPRDTGIRPLDR